MTIRDQSEIKSRNEQKNMSQNSNFSTFARDINFNVDTTRESQLTDQPTNQSTNQTNGAAQSLCQVSRLFK